MASYVRTKTISGANQLRVSVGTTGFEDGDGSQAVFEISDQGGTNMNATARDGVYRLELQGDSELRTLIEALEFALETLRDQTSDD